MRVATIVALGVLTSAVGLIVVTSLGLGSAPAAAQDDPYDDDAPAVRRDDGFDPDFVPDFPTGALGYQFGSPAVTARRACERADGVWGSIGRADGVPRYSCTVVPGDIGYPGVSIVGMCGGRVCEIAAAMEFEIVAASRAWLDLTRALERRYGRARLMDEGDPACTDSVRHRRLWACTLNAPVAIQSAWVFTGQGFVQLVGGATQDRTRVVVVLKYWNREFLSGRRPDERPL